MIYDLIFTLISPLITGDKYHIDITNPFVRCMDALFCLRRGTVTIPGALTLTVTVLRNERSLVALPSEMQPL